MTFPLATPPHDPLGFGVEGLFNSVSGVKNSAERSFWRVSSGRGKTCRFSHPDAIMHGAGNTCEGNFLFLGSLTYPRLKKGALPTCTHRRREGTDAVFGKIDADEREVLAHPVPINQGRSSEDSKYRCGSEEEGKEGT